MTTNVNNTLGARREDRDREPERITEHLLTEGTARMTELSASVLDICQRTINVQMSVASYWQDMIQNLQRAAQKSAEQLQRPHEQRPQSFGTASKD